MIAPPTPPAPPAPGSLEHLRATYGDWLRHQQGLGQTTIKKRQAFLRLFMTFRFGAALGQLNDITPDDILSFLDAPPMKTGGSGRVAGATHLRILFRFLYATRRIRQNLVPLGVPRISAARARGLSRHLPPVEVRKLIDAIHNDDGRGRRNYAMLLMMARLGLRAEEVVAIRLDDINWPASEFLVRGKGGQHDRMPLRRRRMAIRRSPTLRVRGGHARSPQLLCRRPHTGKEVARSLLTAMERADDPRQPALSAREKEVLQRLEGERDKEIAAALGLSEYGVRYHIRKLFAKLGARNRAEAVRRAREMGLVPDAY